MYLITWTDLFRILSTSGLVHWHPSVLPFLLFSMPLILTFLPPSHIISVFIDTSAAKGERDTSMQRMRFRDEVWDWIGDWAGVE